MTVLAENFFHTDTWYVIRNLLIFFGVVFWLAIAYWVYKDARRRIEDPWLVATATLLGLIPPFLGALVYMLFRPPEYLEDVRERDLEIKELEERLARYELRCPVCRAAGRSDVPRLPGLHDQAQAGMRHVQGSARAALAGVSLLRDADRADADARPRHSRRAAPPPHPAALTHGAARRVTFRRRWPSSGPSS